MPLIGTSTSRKNRKGKLARASGVKNDPSLLDEGSSDDSDPEITEVIPIEGFFQRGQKLEIKKSAIKPKTIASPSDWETAIDYAAGDNYDIIETIEQPAETIVPGMAVSDLTGWIPAGLIKLLKQKGINNLHGFQEEALDLILGAEDTVITAPTGAGKTEAFLLPVLARYYSEFRESGKLFPANQLKVLAIYPTKALAADQYGKFEQFLKTGGFRVEIFDGDTSQARRKQVFNNPPTVMITNMDILHFNLRKKEFRQLISTVETVIIDEIHVYESVLGTNLMWILERLERLVNGNYFQVIAASATVANAEEFVSLLVRRPVKGCHCQQGRRTSVVHALVSRAPIKIGRKSSGHLLVKTLFITSLALSTSSKVLVFEDSRRGAEELFMKMVEVAAGQLRAGVHHAGLSASNRRRTEESFRNGATKVLVATPTMELGIDIGDIDVIMSSPVPVNRLLQRFGRGGRRGQSCLAVTDLSGGSPVNEYYRRNPEEFLQTPSTVYFDPASEKVAFYHVLAAAADRELSVAEKFVKNRAALVKLLTKQQLLVELVKGKLFISDSGRDMLKGFSIRGIDESVRVVVKRSGARARAAGQQYATLTSRQISLAIKEFYPGAVVLIGGETYLSKDYNRSKRRVTVVPFPRSRKKYFTRAKVNRQVIPAREKKTPDEMAVTYLTDVTIITAVDSYLKMDYGEDERIRTVDMDDTLSHEMRTRGLVINVPRVLKAVKLDYDFQGWHGLAHLIINFAGLVIGTRGTQDLEYRVERDRLLVHEKTNGGRGIVRALQRELAVVLEKGLANLQECGCQYEGGCPKCLSMYGCLEKNQGLDKDETVKLAGKLLEMLKG